MNPPERLPLVLHGLLWEFPNRKATQGGSFITLLILLCIIPLLYNLRRDLKDQWFVLWCQTRISLLSHPKSSSIDHGLAMSSFVISDPTTSLSNPSNFVGSWDGILVRVKRSSPDSNPLTCPKNTYLSSVSPRGLLSVLRSYRVANMSGSGIF